MASTIRRSSRDAFATIILDHIGYATTPGVGLSDFSRLVLLFLIAWVSTQRAWSFVLG